MFSRKLNEEELKIIELIEVFIRDKHKMSNSHDHSHVLQVTQYSINIAERIVDPVDPFILICGALLHDIGKTNMVFSSMHGLVGAAIAEEFLEALGYSYHSLKPVRDAICRIITRHTPTTMIPPETTEEKIVYDADCLDRLGVIGVLRGFIGKEGSIAGILEKKMKTRAKDFDKLHFDVSRQLGQEANDKALELIEIIRESLEIRKDEIEELELYSALSENMRLQSSNEDEYDE